MTMRGWGFGKLKADFGDQMQKRAFQRLVADQTLELIQPPVGLIPAIGQVLPPFVVGQGGDRFRAHPPLLLSVLAAGLEAPLQLPTTVLNGLFLPGRVHPLAQLSQQRGLGGQQIQFADRIGVRGNPHIPQAVGR